MIQEPKPNVRALNSASVAPGPKRPHPYLSGLYAIVDLMFDLNPAKIISLSLPQTLLGVTVPLSLFFLPLTTIYKI